MSAVFITAAAHLPAVASAQAGAQLGLVFDTDLTLEMQPSHSSPGEVVRITARSLLLDLSDKTLVWFEGSKQIAEGEGLTSIDVAAGPLGSEKIIVVGVYENDTELISQSSRIHPVVLDLLWESDSYTPPYFRGRALPSAGTNIRLEAAASFVRANGSFVPPSEITFTWRRDGYVIPGASGRGRSRATIAGPSLFGVDTISVDARTSDGLFEASASVRVSSVEPRLVLYERHPLFGVMYHRAFPAEASLPNAEISLSAVPYYAAAVHPNDGRLLYEWRINGNELVNDAERPSEITIDARGSSGAAFIELALTHVTNFFLNASGAWGITLLSENAGFGSLFEATQ